MYGTERNYVIIICEGCSIWLLAVQCYKGNAITRKLVYCTLHVLWMSWNSHTVATYQTKISIQRTKTKPKQNKKKTSIYILGG